MENALNPGRSENSFLQRDYMIEHLNRGVCVVNFWKRDGTERLMYATLYGKLIPAEKFPTSGGSPNEEIVRCFDLEAQGWRSFRVDSVGAFLCTEKTPLKSLEHAKEIVEQLTGGQDANPSG